jgi:glycosyltransferase involved in cell wall biosynthesis
MDNFSAPAISIIMTVYNAAPFIDEAIQSILQQSFSDYEFIIIDDGSEDESVSHIRRYKDPRIKLFSVPHGGRATALNIALHHATSTIVAFMDADDVSMKERLENQYAVFQKYPEIGVLSSWFYRITSTGKIKRLVKLPEHHDAIEAGMTQSCTLLLPASMIRKHFLEQVHGFDQTLGATDWGLFLKLLPLTHSHNIQKSLLFYRQHSNSITGQYRQQQQLYSYNQSCTYLMNKLESENSLVERRQILFRLALCEFSLGTIATARMYLLEAWKMGEHSIRWITYYFICLMGDRTVSLGRKIRDVVRRVVLRIIWNVKP